MKEKIIGMLSCICILLLACSEQEDHESLINDAIMGKGAVDVRLSLSSLTEALVQGTTDYRPMSATRAESGNVRAKIANTYKYLVMKKIGTKWYVDTVAQRVLTNEKDSLSTVSVTEHTTFKDLQLTLRPGYYRLLVVLNPRSATWNPRLVPGTVVKEGDSKPVYAYEYYFQQGTYPNKGRRQISSELFVGTAEFTVNKTTDLHSNPTNGNRTIQFARKVMQMRFLLKYKKALPPFEDTQHIVYATLKATNSEIPFCDGVDCWGDAYYNPDKPTMELEICTSLDPHWVTVNDTAQYKTISPHVTVYSPFVFTDEKVLIPYTLDDIKLTGQSQGYNYYYRQPITDLVLKENTIQQLVFQSTPGTTPDGEEEAVTLEYLKEEGSIKLFDMYYECNLP